LYSKYLFKRQEWRGKLGVFNSLLASPAIPGKNRQVCCVLSHFKHQLLSALMRDKSIFPPQAGNDACHIPKSLQIYHLVKAGAVSMHITYDREITRRHRTYRHIVC
jgi:hypothetical protein